MAINNEEKYPSADIASKSTGILAVNFQKY